MRALDDAGDVKRADETVMNDDSLCLILAVPSTGKTSIFSISSLRSIGVKSASP